MHRRTAQTVTITMIAAVAAILAVVGATAASAQPPGAPAGQKYALLVGVKNYGQGTGLRPLRYTERDVDRLSETLQANGYRKENVTLMTQARGARELRFLPVRNKILRELKILLRDVGKDDALIIGFSGHGVQFSGDANTYFCPLDANVEDKETLISVSDVYKQLEDCPAQFKLVLVDACRDDPVRDNAKRASVKLDSVTRPKKIATPGGAAAFFSCSEGESSFEDDKLRHGVFFHTVIEGLGGKGDLDRDQQITLPELEYFVKSRVRDVVRARFNGASQLPQILGSNRGLYPIIGDGSTQLKQVNTLGMSFARVEPGEFVMGAPQDDPAVQADEQPQHPVRITRPYLIAVQEVTIGQYAEFVKESGHTSDGFGFALDRAKGKFVRAKENNWKTTGFDLTDDHPVVNVSWDDAVAFCNWLSKQEGVVYRLPTEAEWEFACRAGTKTRYFTGDDEASMLDFANVADLAFAEMFGVDRGVEKSDGYGFTAPVSSFKPNALGLFDMHGNVWEWCSDYFSPTYFKDSPATDPQGPVEGEERSVRGGSWAGAPSHARSSDRSGYIPTERNLLIGFRVVREP